ncbi:HicA toxin of toxin-antitoxin [Azospirillum oryzae]|uniref:HicA toxin of toxin-antitoxin n=1 Tax=Azospirillum oryzae TaxID=286727 RepID=A0A1X7GDP4_9PROT|nr:type II toxin-antitoxin system HicA family toxin [Azospirillum oryzae]SMF67988.1 HicA toxin of toxin-antitoxin [Azospirillum oryzae]
MNKAHRATIAAIFARPTSASIRWADIEALVIALDGVVEERAGSRVWIEVRDRGAVFHRPHPRPEAKKGAVDAVRKLLINAGITP